MNTPPYTPPTDPAAPATPSVLPTHASPPSEPALCPLAPTPHATRFQELADHRWQFPGCKNLLLVCRKWAFHHRKPHYPGIARDYRQACFFPVMRKGDRWLLSFLSPTRAFADFLKHVLPECEAEHPSQPVSGADLRRTWKRRVLLAFSLFFRSISLIIFLAIAATQDLCAGLDHPIVTLPGAILMLIVFYYCFSRANEAVYAFLGDALRMACGKPATSDLNKADRICLALWGYLALIVDFSIIYWLFRAGFNPRGEQLHSIWDALYFSGVTMATLGYGDISPLWLSLRLLVLYQMACGIALLVLSFAIYLGNPEDPHPNPPGKC